MNNAPQERLGFVQSKQLCLVCLNKHPTPSCKFTWKCKVCRGNLNSLLHVSNVQHVVSSSANAINDAIVLLPTAQLTLSSKSGVQFTFRALIDQGSMTSFVSERVMQSLQWERQPVATLVTGVTGKPTRARGRTEFEIESVYKGRAPIHISALILPKLSRPLPEVDNHVSTFDLGRPSLL